MLKKTPVADYDELLQKGSQPDAYRPTMYDFLVFNALQFYSSGEQVGAKAQDAFELNAEDPVFDSEAKFIAWQIKTTDTESRTVKALKLYQDLQVSCQRRGQERLYRRLTRAPELRQK